MFRDTVTENCSGHGLRYSFVEEKWQKMFKNIYDRHRKACRGTGQRHRIRCFGKLKELATENTIVTSSSGKEYRFNINEKMNDLNIKSPLSTGQLEKGRKYDLDYDNKSSNTKNGMPGAPANTPQDIVLALARQATRSST